MSSAASEADSVDSDYSSIASFSPLPNSNTKSCVLEYSVYSPIDLKNIQNQVISLLSPILGCSDHVCISLLRYFQWNKEKLIENYLENPIKVSNDAGVIIDDNQLPKLLIVDGFSCDICCDDSPDLPSLALACQHRFCKNCYRDYLTQKIMVQGESRKIQCPANCPLIVNESAIELCTNDVILKKYQLLLTRTFVDDQPFLKWCPAPNCEYAIECKISPSQLDEVIPTVECLCGHTWCFGCGLPDHQPCICSLVKLWLKKCADDSETANWISANTKECTKCKATIEKNGGCNHMSCKKCKYEFCWVCLGPWSEHGSQFYHCNRFEEKTSIDARDIQAQSRQALERYLHYYNRYANHEQSAKLDKELYEKTEKKMEQMQRSSDLSWIEVQYLKKAVQVLLTSRFTLKWTYALAYYLARDNATHLFEENQRDLEMSVEMLSEMLEQPIDPLTIAQSKQIILDKTVYVSSRRKIVLDDTLKGLADHRWSYLKQL